MKKVLLLLIVHLISISAFANDVKISCSVVDGSGGMSEGDTYLNVNATAQTSGTFLSMGGTMVNYSGFLNMFSLRSNLDTDTDGLPDEIDLDNDNDGSIDNDEAVAGTNPNDPKSVFQITMVSSDASKFTVSWVGRGGKTYDIYKCNNLVNGDTDLLLTTNVTGGIYPWYETTNTFIDNTAVLDNKRFYLIKVRK